MIRVEILPTGACSAIPGPGGWGALLRCAGLKRNFPAEKRKPPTTGWSWTAVISALAALKTSCDISLYTDSKYVMDGITRWLPNWKKNGWKTSNKKSPVKNVDLWQRLDELAGGHEIRWIWVKGHAGHAENERVDELGQKCDQEFGLNRLCCQSAVSVPVRLKFPATPCRRERAAEQNVKRQSAAAEFFHEFRRFRVADGPVDIKHNHPAVLDFLFNCPGFQKP